MEEKVLINNYRYFNNIKLVHMSIWVYEGGKSGKLYKKRQLKIQKHRFTCENNATYPINTQ